MALTESERQKSLDLIILLHTLEHIVNPKAYIEYLGKYLNNAGAFFIEVPDFTFINESTDDLFIEHVNYFTNKQIEQMFDDCGYDVINSQITVNKDYPACPRYISRIIAVRRLSVRITLEMRIEALQKSDDKMGRILIRLNKKLAKLKNRARIGIYSASWLTSECLMKSNLKEFEIVGIFDRDPKKWNTSLGKSSVYPPEKIVHSKMDYLLILNEGYEKEICDNLEIMGFPSEKIVKWSTIASQKNY